MLESSACWASAFLFRLSFLASLLVTEGFLGWGDLLKIIRGKGDLPRFNVMCRLSKVSEKQKITYQFNPPGLCTRLV
uniref:Putative secreted protein n=1 Tax=Ixodes ricinus TaxID=34613 RepID=A0A6B0U4U4_IXORI